MASVGRILAIAFASAFGSGFFPIAPGTWGTAVGTLTVFLFHSMGWLEGATTLAIVTLLWSLLGYVSILGLPKTWIHDDGRIVVDEVVGLFVTMLFIPITTTSLIGGFVLFRIFDIWKPLGIRYFDNFSSHWSVIVDDLLAGVYANLALRGLILLLAWI